MNLRLTTAALLALAACAPTFAQDDVQYFRQEVLSTRPRAEVRADLERARLAGELDRRNQSYGAFERSVATPSMLTRAEVLAEFQRARKSHELDLHSYSVVDTVRSATTMPARGDGSALADKTARPASPRPAS